MQRLWGYVLIGSTMVLAMLALYMLGTFFKQNVVFQRENLEKTMFTNTLKKRVYDPWNDIAEYNMVFFKDDRPTFSLCWFIRLHVLIMGWISSNKVSLCQFCKLMAGSWVIRLSHPRPVCKQLMMLMMRLQMVLFSNTLMMHFLIVHVCCNFSMFFFPPAISIQRREVQIARIFEQQRHTGTRTIF